MGKSKSEIWSKRIQAQSASGKTIASWCADENINIHSLRKWKEKFKKKASLKSETNPIQWVPLNNSSKQVQIKLEKNGLTIELSTQLDNLSELSSLVKEIQALC